MSMKFSVLMVVVSMALFASAVSADCELDGTTYPEGTMYGNYVCEDGEWVRRDG